MSFWDRNDGSSWIGGLCLYRVGCTERTSSLQPPNPLHTDSPRRVGNGVQEQDPEEAGLSRK